MKIYIAEHCSDINAAKQTIFKQYAPTKDFSIEHAKSGEPILTLDNKQSGYISISHTGDTLIMAFSDNPVGIDIELSDRKTSRINMDVEQWTKYEAYGKWLGKGINRQVLKMQLPNNLIKTFKRGKYVISVCGESDVEEIISSIDNGE